jgi:hypothetical protein
MSKITRTTQKIFGINAPDNQVTAFGTIKSGTVNFSKSPKTIMNTNFEAGWSSAIDDDYAPYRQDVNSVQLAVTSQLAYLFQQGVAEWDSGTDYHKGSTVKVVGTDTKFYQSLSDNNSSAVTDTSKWTFMFSVNNGVVSVNTPTTGDSSEQIANTKFVTEADTKISTALSSDLATTKSTLTTEINNLKAKFKVVEKLPSSTVEDTFYFVLE